MEHGGERLEIEETGERFPPTDTHEPPAGAFGLLRECATFPRGTGRLTGGLQNDNVRYSMLL